MALRCRQFGWYAALSCGLITFAAYSAPPASLLAKAAQADAAQSEAARPAAAQKTEAGQFEAQYRPLIASYCTSCHSGEKPGGDLRLDSLSLELTDAANRQQWGEVARRLENGQMPPAGKPRPAKEQIEAFVNWLAPRLRVADAAARDVEGRVVLRRLNRVEYENTICDLLGVEVELKDQLPADGSADGFDNAAAAHHTSAFLMEKYLEAADTALNAAIANRPQPPPSKTTRYSIKDVHPVKTTTEDVYRFREDGEVVCFCSSEP